MTEEERNDLPEIEDESPADFEDELESDAAEGEAEQDADPVLAELEAEPDAEPEFPEMEPEAEPELESEFQPQSVLDADDIDIEQALAAVASLHQLVQQEDDEEPEEILGAASAADEFEIGEYRRVPLDEYETNREEAAPVILSDLPRPPASTLVRGQAASVVPALLLIVSGAALTFLLTTTDQVIQPLLLAGGLAGILGVALITYWLSSGRWANGAFFAGSTLLLVGATTLWLLLSESPGWMQGYPLLLTAFGVALVLTDIFSPSSMRVWAGGLVLAVAGLAGASVTAGLLQQSLLQIASGLLPVALGIVVVLLIAPFIQWLRR